MKRLFVLFLVIISTITLMISCKSTLEPSIPDGAIPVLSNYPNLSYIVPGDYDVSKYEDGTWARYHYSTYVTEVNGQLAIMPNHKHGNSGTLYVQSYETYTVDNLIANKHGVYLADELIIDEACIGMIASYSKNQVLVFTVTDDGNGYIYSFECNENGMLSLTDNRIPVNGKPQLFYIDWPNTFTDAPHELYLITDAEIMVIDAYEYLNFDRSSSTIKAKSISVPDWWKYLRFTSTTMTNDRTLFIGEREGVVGIKNGIISYYPIDYTRAIYGDNKK